MIVSTPRFRVAAGRCCGLALRAGVAALALLLVAPAHAQGLPGYVAPALDASGPDQMALEADQLEYDFDNQKVTAKGNVRIFYKGNRIEAARLSYDQKAGRLVASGGVRITQADGTVISTESADVTDDYAEGFIDSLNILTPDNTRFAAASAQRKSGYVTILDKGVYTACEPCKDNPRKPPLWQLKAGRIVHDGKAKMIFYEEARLEFFGVPIAYVPYFAHPDPSKKRQSGVLTPRFAQTKELGFGVKVPYFWALAPNYDVTFTPTVYTEQGLHTDIRFRHMLPNGAYDMRLTGIRQLQPDNFDGRSGDRDVRGSIHSAGEFAVAPRWRVGWDITATTDRTYGRDYRIEGATGLDVASTVYLNGMSERNWFDLRGYAFRVQREDTVEEDRFLLPSGAVSSRTHTHDDQKEQPIVHPVIDHNYIFAKPLLGGEVRSDSNVTSLSRDQTDIRTVPVDDFYAGVAGSFTRASNQLSWQRRLIGPLGQVVTPFAYVRTDLYSVSPEDALPGLLEDKTVFRAMPAVGLEWSWPILVSAPGVTQTFSPIAQLIVRPDETHVGEVPNEDAQSLVFDDSVLFARDKFSGYDRVEGGTRANLGFAYNAELASGLVLDAVFGQSIHLSGKNSFGDPGIAATGIGSGLDTDRSDYVGRLTVALASRISATARGRFDKDDGTLRRGEISGTVSGGRSQASLGYLYLEENPEIGILTPRHEARTAAKVAVTKTWSVLGGATFDMDEQARVASEIGLAYDDECFNLSAVYAETRDRYTDLLTNQEVRVRVNLRTVGGTSYTRSLFGDGTEDAEEATSGSPFAGNGLLSNF